MSEEIEKVTPNCKKCAQIDKQNQKLEKQIEKVNGLLRRFYGIIEMNHLNDHKLIACYCNSFSVPRSLGDDVFNYLQSKDQVFKETTIKRQKRYRKKIMRGKK